MTLYGTANSLFTFVVGGKTDISNEEHLAQVVARFNYYFGCSLQQEWLRVLGDAAGADLTQPGHALVQFETMLGFWHRLYIVYTIWGLGTGLLPLQMTNSLVEIGLVSAARVGTMADFVSQTPKLGAARALSSLGFSIDVANPSSAALAFQVSYKHIQQLLLESGTDFTVFRYDPVDHEHILCKTI
jgi:hypothetical protein